MIEATEISNNHFVVRAIHPLTGKVVQQLSCESEGAAIRIAHTVNRLHILDVMTRWLNQRSKAMLAANFLQQKAMADKMLEDLMFLRHTSVKNIRAFIARKEKTILFIGPRQKSEHYPYFEAEILTIVEFCKDMKEVTV